MASQDSLENLITALAGAVVEAQHRIEDHQIKNFQRYFPQVKEGYETRRPASIQFRLPSLDPNAAPDDEVTYRVPLLPIVASSLLKIKEVEITFDTELVGLTGDEGTGETKDDTQKSAVGIDIRGAKETGRAHIVLKVEGRELSEGMARVVDRLVQSQGEIKTE